MPRHLDAVLVRVVDGRLQLLGRDVHVGLERRHALSGPVVDRARGVVRTREGMQLRADRRCAFEVRPGEKELRPWNLAFVDGLLD